MSNVGTAENAVHEAVGRVLQVILDRLGAEMVDRVWIFPPLVRGRKEWGLVAVSGLTDDVSQRVLYTARYSAELTGSGTTFESEVTLEGSAPPDRLPRVMDGVVRRSDLQLGEAKEVEILGDPERLNALIRANGWNPPVAAPRIEAQNVEAPNVEAPSAEAPSIEAPKTEAAPAAVAPTAAPKEEI